MANLLDHRTKVIRQNDMRYGGDEVRSVPISSTNNQLIPCNHWIQHTSVHYNKAHIGQ